jgi:hypothetical protein
MKPIRRSVGGVAARTAVQLHATAVLVLSASLHGHVDERLGTHATHNVGCADVDVGALLQTRGDVSVALLREQSELVAFGGWAWSRRCAVTSASRYSMATSHTGHRAMRLFTNLEFSVQ